MQIANAAICDRRNNFKSKHTSLCSSITLVCFQSIFVYPWLYSSSEELAGVLRLLAARLWSTLVALITTFKHPGSPLFGRGFRRGFDEATRRLPSARSGTLRLE